MSKLAAKNQFFDLSDYGRFIAKRIALTILNTPLTPVHVTFGFLIVGLIAIWCILNQFFITAFFLLILKSIIDAADGELARLRNKPSYIGRYLDSTFDLFLNFGILYAIYYSTNGSLTEMLIAFFALQLQGTVYNYYYTILRNNSAGGDTTSRIEENSFPKALHGENQKIVNFLFVTFCICYSCFDKIVLALDGSAKRHQHLPNWFMTFVSIYGLGFQLLIIGVLLALGLITFVIPFIIYYSIFIVVIIGIRKSLLHK